jgi:hypothetical protein
MKKIHIIISIFLFWIACKDNIVKPDSIEKPIANTIQSSSLSKSINEYIKNELDSDYILDDELYKMYRQVLLSEKTFSFNFVVAESENEYYINNISYDGYEFIPHHFSFIDMNNDTVPEIVIEGTIGMSAGFVLVLREYDGRIIGHEFSHRQMSDIKKDGTYHASGGASYNGYYQLSFNDDSYLQHNIVRMDTEEDSNGEYKQIYFIFEKQVEEKDFWKLWEVQKNKEEPRWINFELRGDQYLR